MIKIAPSILSADFAAMGEAVEQLGRWGADYVHCDVMDGLYVPNITFGQGMVAALKQRTDLPLDVHLMVEAPERHIDSFIDAGADILTFHVEACRHPHRGLQAIRNRKAKSGIVLNPGTPVQALDYLYEEADMILFMSVNPGFGGQAFIPSVIDKIEKAANEIARRNLRVDIEVDGGVNAKNARRLIDAGANVLVAGSAVFLSEDPAKTIEALRSGE
ncbi:MAG: ribulose-phosphate 3-epimerase [Christensenellales bacterium]|jgi:ribulose-phosphate 3-epimerase